MPPSVDGAECSTAWGAPGFQALQRLVKNWRVLKHGQRLQPCNGEAFTRHRSHHPLMHRLIFARRSTQQLRDLLLFGLAFCLIVHPEPNFPQGVSKMRNSREETPRTKMVVGSRDAKNLQARDRSHVAPPRA